MGSAEGTGSLRVTWQDQGVGAMAAAFDAMQWMRGRAIGGWVFAIGFGWVGHLALGAATETFGVQWALAATGATPHQRALSRDPAAALRRSRDGRVTWGHLKTIHRTLGVR